MLKKPSSDYCNCTVPEQIQQELIWSRFVNTKGLPGKNIPCDIHMEHLNKTLKTIVRRSRANATPASIVRGSKCLRVVGKVCDAFADNVGVRKDWADTAE